MSSPSCVSPFQPLSYWFLDIFSFLLPVSFLFLFLFFPLLWVLLLTFLCCFLVIFPTFLSPCVHHTSSYKTRWPLCLGFFFFYHSFNNQSLIFQLVLMFPFGCESLFSHALNETMLTGFSLAFFCSKVLPLKQGWVLVAGKKTNAAALFLTMILNKMVTFKIMWHYYILLFSPRGLWRIRSSRRTRPWRRLVTPRRWGMTTHPVLWVPKKSL